MTRLVKQLIFGGIYLAIILAIAWPLYRAVNPAATCTDGLQNGGEEGVDCGALACGVLCAPSVKPLEIAPVELIENADGSWDALAIIENPNGRYGASRVDWVLPVVDGAGKVVASRRGRTYANPAVEQYLVVPLLKPDGTPASASLQVDPAQVQWGAVAGDAPSVQFAVRGDTITLASQSARFEATVVNKSDYDFDRVDVVVFLLDASGATVAAGSTVVGTLRAGGDRGITVLWPFAVPDAVRSRVQVSTNLFDNANYLRAFGSPEQLQGP
jgi:hypothetical protein